MRLINRWSFVVLACTLVLWTTSSFAEVSVSKYAEFKKTVPQFKDYLTGLGRGILWANTMLVIQGKPSLFCMPENLALDDGIILSLIDQEIRSPSTKKPWGKEDTVEMIAAFAFVSRFPCPQ
jgi:hypothetical protein